MQKTNQSENYWLDTNLLQLPEASKYRDDISLRFHSVDHSLGSKHIYSAVA